MRVSDHIHCADWPCQDLDTQRFSVPAMALDPIQIGILMICEAPARDPEDDLAAEGRPFYLETTCAAFGDAGHEVESLTDILELGVYITTAVKCAKTAYAVSGASVDHCSRLLEREIALFPAIRAILCMGDVAIRAVNNIARRADHGRVIPKGSTYKIRGQPYHWGTVRVVPSYLQTGKSYLIEKSKRRMIAEDLAQALRLLS